MTVRLSHSSFTGTDRTEVAVGTLSDSSMLATVRAGAPRSTVYVGWSLASAGAGVGFSLGTGRSVPLAGSAALLSGRGVARGWGGALVAAAGLAAALLAVTAGCRSPRPRRRERSAPSPCRSASGDAPLADPDPFALKYDAQLGSTLPGSRWNCSYISSTSHSLAPKSEDGWSDGLVCCGTGGFASSGYVRVVVVVRCQG